MLSKKIPLASELNVYYKGQGRKWGDQVGSFYSAPDEDAGGLD